MSAFDGSNISEVTHAPEALLYRKHGFILWTGRGRQIPADPGNPDAYSESDMRHWHEMEYGPLSVQAEPPLPSPGDGPKGKRVICLKAESDAYQRECEKGMIRMAQALGMNLSIRVSGWDTRAQDLAFEQAISERPDLIVSVPGAYSHSALWYKRAYEAEIPVVSTILIPNNEAFRYHVAWCGHDQWRESRMLARQFAELMDYTGEYCIVRHMPDTSSYYSRTYGVLTELTRIAPGMRCIAMETSYLREDLTQELVAGWLDEFGARLKGIVSSNDIAVLSGINKAIHAAGRSEVIRVSNGTTREGLACIKEGTVQALTFKSPSLDGGLPMQVAADWFNGLVVDRVRFLPTHIITGDDVDEFLTRRDDFHEVDLEPLRSAIETHNNGLVDKFFDSIYLRFVYAKVVSLELFRGFTIELFSQLVAIMHDERLRIEPIVGTYETVFKNLFYQPSIEGTIEWMRQAAKRIVGELRGRRNQSTIQQVVDHVQHHLSEPLTLQLLASEFSISARYLGQLFKEQTGASFNDYVNRHRIERAAKFLRNSSMTAAEIAREVGYSDSNYFYKIFKRYTGYHPTAYRKINE